MEDVRRSDAIVARTIQRAAEQMEAEYRAARAGDAERLYEAFATTIDEQKPNVEVLLFVLKILEHGLLEQKSRELFAQAGATAEVIHSEVHGHSHAVQFTPEQTNGHAPMVTDDLAQAPLR